MLYSYCELEKRLGNYSQVKKAVESGKYFKVAHGYYSDEDTNINELEVLFATYPNAILTLEGAFAFYDMSDYIPEKYVIATSQKAHKINNNKVKQLYISDELLNIGKEKVKTKYGFINIYDKERMLIELFRLKSKLSYDYFKEVINSYRKLVMEDQLDIPKLLGYLSLFSNGVSLTKQIRDVVF